MELLCLLPSTTDLLAVDVWCPHGCEGYYKADSWWYGPGGIVGMNLSGTSRWT